MIYYKMDWYAAMIYNRSVSFVLNKLGIFDDYVDQLMCSGTLARGVSYGESMTFLFNGVRLSIERYQFETIISTLNGDLEKFCDVACDSIRLELSGTGLEWLRSSITPFNPDKDLHDPHFWDISAEDPTSVNVKRVDFAFDFVNYKPEFLQELHAFFEHQERDGYLRDQTRVRIKDQRGGLRYEQRWSAANRSIYLGSPSSDALLRLYDKKLECSKNKVLDTDRVPEIFGKYETELDSWYRIELQSRDKIAQFLLFQPDDVINFCRLHSGNNNIPYIEDVCDLSYVLRYIFEKYLLVDEEKKVPDFLSSLYNWDSLPALVPHTNYYAEKRAPTFTRLTDYIFGQAFSSLSALIAYIGIDSFIQMFLERYQQIQESDDPVLVRKRHAYNQKVFALLTESESSADDLYVNSVYFGGKLISQFKDIRYRFKARS